VALREVAMGETGFFFAGWRQHYSTDIDVVSEYHFRASNKWYSAFIQESCASVRKYVARPLFGLVLLVEFSVVTLMVE